MGVTRVSDRVMNLGHFLAQAAARTPDAPAMVRGDEVRSFGEMDARVSAACAALRKRGVVRGDRVLVQSRNSFAMFEVMFAVWRLGAVLVPVNFRLSPAEVGYIAGNCGARALIYDPVFAEHRDAARKEAPIALVVSLGEPMPGELAWEDLASGAASFPR